MENTVLVSPTETFFTTVFGESHAKLYAVQNFMGIIFPIVKDNGKYLFRKKPFIRIVSGMNYMKRASLFILLYSYPETVELDRTCFEEQPDVIE